VRLVANGRTVNTLKEGRYSTTVTDKSKKAGFVFQLMSKNGGVVRSVALTNLPFVGRSTATVTLQKGQWVFAPAGSGKKTYFVVAG
jgi:hypothetical protein